MSLSISSVPYADWHVLCPVLSQNGYLPRSDSEGRYIALEQLENASADQGPWLLLYVRPELAVARAVEAGESAVKALAQWEFAAGLLLAHCKRHPDQTILLDFEEARSQPGRVVASLDSRFPGLGQSVEGPGGTVIEGQNATPVSQVSLLLAKALVADSPVVQSLLAKLTEFRHPIEAGYKLAAVDFHAVQSLLPLEGQPPVPAPLPEAPEWLMRQLFHAQEQLNHYYMREESAHAELTQAREALARLQARNAALIKQVATLEREGGKGPAGVWLQKIARRVKSVLGGGLARRKRLKQQVALVRASDYFDEAWYLSQNPDIQQAGMDPAWHFVAHGGQEGRAPSPRFDAMRYLTRNPDVAEAGVNPLVHYLTQGKAEGRPL